MSRIDSSTGIRIGRLKYNDFKTQLSRTVVSFPAHSPVCRFVKLFAKLSFRLLFVHQNSHLVPRAIIGTYYALLMVSLSRPCRFQVAGEFGFARFSGMQSEKDCSDR